MGGASPAPPQDDATIGAATTARADAPKDGAQKPQDSPKPSPKTGGVEQKESPKPSPKTGGVEQKESPKPSPKPSPMTGRAEQTEDPKAEKAEEKEPPKPSPKTEIGEQKNDRQAGQAQQKEAPKTSPKTGRAEQKEDPKAQKTEQREAPKPSPRVGRADQKEDPKAGRSRQKEPPKPSPKTGKMEQKEDPKSGKTQQKEAPKPSPRAGKAPQKEATKPSPNAVKAEQKAVGMQQKSPRKEKLRPPTPPPPREGVKNSKGVVIDSSEEGSAIDRLIQAFADNFESPVDAYAYCTRGAHVTLPQIYRAAQRLKVRVEPVERLVRVVERRVMSISAISPIEFVSIFGWTPEEGRDKFSMEIYDPHKIEYQVSLANRRLHEKQYQKGNEGLKRENWTEQEERETPQCEALRGILEKGFRTVLHAAVELDLDLAEMNDKSDFLRKVKRLPGMRESALDWDELMNELADPGTPPGMIRNRNFFRYCKWHPLNFRTLNEDMKNTRLLMIKAAKSHESLDTTNKLPGLFNRERPLSKAFQKVLQRYFDDVVEAFVFFDIENCHHVTKRKFELGVQRLRFMDGFNDRQGDVDITKLFAELDAPSLDGMLGMDEFVLALRWHNEPVGESNLEAIFKARKKMEQKLIEATMPWKKQSSKSTESLPSVETATSPVRTPRSFSKSAQQEGASAVATALIERQLKALSKERKSRVVKTAEKLVAIWRRLRFEDPVEVFAFFDHRGVGYISRADLAQGLAELKIHDVDVFDFPLTRYDEGVERADLFDFLDILSFCNCDPDWLFAKALEEGTFEDALNAAVEGRDEILARVSDGLSERTQRFLEHFEKKAFKGLSVQLPPPSQRTWTRKEQSPRGEISSWGRLDSAKGGEGLESGTDEGDEVPPQEGEASEQAPADQEGEAPSPREEAAVSGGPGPGSGEEESEGKVGFGKVGGAPLYQGALAAQARKDEARVGVAGGRGVGGNAPVVLTPQKGVTAPDSNRGIVPYAEQQEGGSPTKEEGGPPAGEGLRGSERAPEGDEEADPVLAEPADGGWGLGSVVVGGERDAADFDETVDIEGEWNVIDPSAPSREASPMISNLQSEGAGESRIILTGELVRRDDKNAGKNVDMNSILNAVDLERVELEDGTVYEGQVGKDHGTPNGFGLIVFGKKHNQRWYIGGFTAGQFSGLGILKWADGTFFIGNFEAGQPHGAGVETYANGSVYEGELKKGRRDGVGCLFGRHIPEVYCGEWMNASRHGRGFTGTFEHVKNEEDNRNAMEGWEMRGRVVFDSCVDVECGRVTKRVAKQDRGQQDILMLGISERCTDARITANIAWRQCTAIVERMDELAPRMSPKPPEGTRANQYETMSPRVARRLRKGPTEGSVVDKHALEQQALKRQKQEAEAANRSQLPLLLRNTSQQRLAQSRAQLWPRSTLALAHTPQSGSWKGHAFLAGMVKARAGSLGKGMSFGSTPRDVEATPRGGAAPMAGKWGALGSPMESPRGKSRGESESEEILGFTMQKEKPLLLGKRFMRGGKGFKIPSIPLWEISVSNSSSPPKKRAWTWADSLEERPYGSESGSAGRPGGYVHVEADTFEAGPIEEAEEASREASADPGAVGESSGERQRAELARSLSFAEEAESIRELIKKVQRRRSSQGGED